MRVVPCVLMIAMALGLPGCALFKKQPAAAQQAPDPLLPRPEAKNSFPNPEGGGVAQANAVLPTSTGSGLLAGQVITSFSAPVKGAYILVSLPKEGTKTSARKPLDVPTDSQGYFTISGLEPGRPYQLVARARDGSHMMAGTVWATPPNPRVLIRISEDFVTKATPPLPPPPAWPGLNQEKTVPTQADNPQAKAAIPPAAKASADQGWAPSQTPAISVPNEAERKPEFASDPRTAHPERMAEGETKPKDLLRIRPQVPPASSNQGSPLPAPTLPAARVPSCILAGNQLVNLALYDLDNRPWEFRQHTGKLVLLDFWSTTCVPCVQTIPHLNGLQYKYRSSGLQVVGIAYEGGGSYEQQRRKVDDFCQVKRIGYKVLMGGGSSCPVLNQFGVRGLPTLVLLDAHGWIIWKHVGALDQEASRDLETRIRSHLGVDER